MFRNLRYVVVAAIAIAAGVSHGQSVTLNGSLGGKMAVLVIDGVPRTLAVGQTVQGAKLLAIDDTSARVQVEGKTQDLTINAGNVRLAVPAAQDNQNEVVLTAGPGGHFISGGTINGRSVQFMVDTGATVVAIGQKDAEKIGIAYQTAPRQVTHTANGQVAVYRVMLNSIRLGEVETYNVEAIVMPGDMTHVLLGNSFLTRFQMKRENDRMTLSKRM